jgi:UDP-glucose:(heptosyl)LPS alpha-1,3-glucosyltransferase
VRFAFCLFKYFPFGGLQRDFLKIVTSCLSRGHHVDVFAGAWEGEIPENFHVSILPAHGLTNHRRCESFAKSYNDHRTQSEYDSVIGFNKMPGLDVYFSADYCFAAKAYEKGLLYRLAGRCRSYLRLEQAVFDSQSKTEILLISEREKDFFIRHYNTAEERFHLLPPGISKDRLAPRNTEEARASFRRDLNIGMDEKVVLMVGSGFKTKGVDRAIRGLSSLTAELGSTTILLVVGDDNSKSFERLAKRLGVADRVRFVGGREDVPRFLVGADLLLHPAVRENTGTVLVEAMASGLPVLATDVCGYGSYIRSARAGELIPAPFRQETLNRLLLSMLTSENRSQWGQNGMEYVSKNDVFNLHEKAVDIIEQVASC